MKTEAEIIGATTRRILESNPSAGISRKRLIEELTREYLKLYETRTLTNDFLIYESVLWLLINQPASVDLQDPEK
ncbi:hypothetical protein [Phytobacter sp. AG2a]